MYKFLTECIIKTGYNTLYEYQRNSALVLGFFGDRVIIRYEHYLHFIMLTIQNA